MLTTMRALCSNGVMELARGVRSQLQALVSGLAGADLTPMSLGLSHSLSRYKLKFSPDKVRRAGAVLLLSSRPLRWCCSRRLPVCLYLTVTVVCWASASSSAALQHFKACCRARHACVPSSSMRRSCSNCSTTSM